MERRVAVRAIAVRDNKLLCVRLQPYPGAFSTSKAKIWWCLPGGGLDSEESLVDGIKREIFEETGIKPNIGSLLYVHQFATPETNAEHLEFFFNITNVDDYVNVDLSKSSHGQKEIAEIAYVDPAKTNLLPEFLQSENISKLIKNNLPPKVFSFLS